MALPKYALLELTYAAVLLCFLALDPLYRHTLGAALTRLAGIGFSGVKILGVTVGSTHPFRFLNDVNQAVETWIGNGKAWSERGVVYALNQLIDALALYVGVPLALGLALKDLADWVVHAIGHAVTRVEHTTVIRKVEQVTKVITSVTAKQFAHLATRVATLEHELTHALHATAHAIPATFKGIDYLEREARRDAARLTKLEKRTVGAGAAALVAVALAKLGLDWIKCNAAKGLFKKRGCGLWNGIDDLLGMFFDVAILANICQVIPVLEEVFSVVASPVIGKLASVGAGLCDASYAQGPMIEPPVLHLPPVDGTLYLTAP